MTQLIDNSQLIIENIQLENEMKETQKQIEEKKPVKSTSSKKSKKTKKKKKVSKKNNNYQYSMNEGMVLSTMKELLNEFENPIKPQQIEKEMRDEILQQLKPNIIVGVDNFYTTKSVINYFNEKNIGYVGTVRANRPYLSENFKESKLQLHESKQVTNNNTTLVNYRAKKDKNVFVMSNQIDRLRKCIGNKEKPEIILLYNSMKGATDSFDHLISNMDIRRKSNRFQLAVLFDLLNIIITNIFIIKRMNEPDLNHEDFVYEMAMNLLGETIGNEKPNVCCTMMEEEINCKIHNGFFIIREDHPDGQKVENGTTKQICNQCGNPIKPHTMMKITMKFCKTCFDSLGK